MNSDDELCPFSNVIAGKWCGCPHAKRVDRCSGKMRCLRESDLRAGCVELDTSLKNNARFILGKKSEPDNFTHAQLMKIRCGGLTGMQRVLGLTSDEIVNIRDILDKLLLEYGETENFAYNQIVQDIKHFTFR